MLLDITHLDRETVLDRLPRMYRQFVDLSMLDITQTPMEVAPTAHYSMGGVWVQAETHRTDVEGLYAVGECATGLHGANRLGGNSLVECIVFGKIVGAEAARWSASLDVQVRDRAAIAAAADEVSALLGQRGGREFPRPLQRAVRDLMSEHAGVVRSEAGLRQGLERLEEIGGRIGTMEVRARHRGLRRPRPRLRPQGLGARRARHARVRTRAPRDPRRPQPRGLPRPGPGADRQPALAPRGGR